MVRTVAPLSCFCPEMRGTPASLKDLRKFGSKTPRNTDNGQRQSCSLLLATRVLHIDRSHPIIIIIASHRPFFISSVVLVLADIYIMKILFIQTGGTIDKDYPRSKGGYAFEFGEPATKRLLDRLRPSFDFEVVTAFQKDSLEVTDQDRQVLANLIEQRQEGQ